MHQFIHEEFPELAELNINWQREDVAYEFAAITLLLIGAKNNNWKVKIVDIPKNNRFDSWSTLPKHGYSKFGSISRRTNLNELMTILQPKFLLIKNSREISIYYQGFPPIEANTERPDWTIVDGSYSIKKIGEQIELILQNPNDEYRIVYDTLLTPVGPRIVEQHGLFSILSIIEVSINKPSETVNKQLIRYKEKYHSKIEIAVLGNQIKSSFPCIYLPTNQELKIADVKEKAEFFFQKISSVL